MSILDEVDRGKIKHFALFNDLDVVERARVELLPENIGARGLYVRNLSIILGAKSERFLGELQGEEYREGLRRQRELELQRERQKRYREKLKFMRQQRLFKRLEDEQKRVLGVPQKRNWCEQKVSLKDNSLLSFMLGGLTPKLGVLELSERGFLEKINLAKEQLVFWGKSGFRFKLSDAEKVLVEDKNLNKIVFIVALLFLVQEGVLDFVQEENVIFAWRV